MGRIKIWISTRIRTDHIKSETEYRKFRIRSDYKRIRIQYQCDPIQLGSESEKLYLYKLRCVLNYNQITIHIRYDGYYIQF